LPNPEIQSNASVAPQKQSTPRILRSSGLLPPMRLPEEVTTTVPPENAGSVERPSGRIPMKLPLIWLQQEDSEIEGTRHPPTSQSSPVLAKTRPLIRLPLPPLTLRKGSMAPEACAYPVSSMRRV